MFRQTHTAALAVLAALSSFTFTRAQETKVDNGKKQITNSIGMKLTLVPSGEFMMGSGESAEETAAFFKTYYGAAFVSANRLKHEHPQHRVRITKPFYLGTYHITRGQFRQFIKESQYKNDPKQEAESAAYGWNPEKKHFGYNKDYSSRKAGFEQTDEHPAVYVSWIDATAFCKWLSGKDGEIYQLPSEAQWEYACRAERRRDIQAVTTRRRWPSWQTYATQRPRRTCRAGRGRFTPAMAMPSHLPWASTSPTRSGSTTCTATPRSGAQDWYGKDYYDKSPVDDPTGPNSGSFRVVRGGSWSDMPSSTRSAERSGSAPGNRGDGIGFRVLRTK